ncbi:hypothetical protein PFISCL1PPCAC_3144, partial [Pristionchus fissidentatus]
FFRMIPAILLNYLILITSTLSVSCIVTLFMPQLGSIIGEFTTYGKTNEQKHRNITKWFAVPKRFFRHFYILAVLSVAGWTYVGLQFTWKEMKSEKLVPYMRALTNKTPQIPFSMGMIVLGLMMFHVTRRFIETMLISVYSDTSMNIFHYLLGMIHYVILPLSVVCETLGFASKSVYPLRLDLDGWSSLQYMGLLTFFYANFHQFKIAVQLAKSRRDSTGNVQNTAHAIQYGGWFDLVSCPHFLMEMLIYGSIACILPRGATAFKYLLGFVVVNQAFAALITHRWYKAHFKNYPPQRKAVIPYIL